jgi:hypothetical protein
MSAPLPRPCAWKLLAPCMTPWKEDLGIGTVATRREGTRLELDRTRWKQGGPNHISRPVRVRTNTLVQAQSCCALAVAHSEATSLSNIDDPV